MGTSSIGVTGVAERLESRTLLAGDMRAGVDQGLLSVVGDEADNAVLVTQIGRSIYVIGVWKDGAPTTVNGRRLAAFPAAGVQDVIIDMAGGDDHATAARLRVPGVLGMDGGDFGNDTINVLATRAGRMGIRMGNGDDRLIILGTTVSGDTTLHGEEGRDTLVILASTFGSKQVTGFEFVFPSSAA